MEFGGIFCGFAGVFEGGSGKMTDLVWCFGGEFVVDCVANVVSSRTTFEVGKIRHVFQLYFLVACDDGKIILSFDGFDFDFKQKVSMLGIHLGTRDVPTCRQR